MKIYELRKTVSKNKKYRFIYELVVKGIVVDKKCSRKDAVGCLILHVPKKGAEIGKLLLSGQLEFGQVSIGLTFDRLSSYCDF